MSVRLVRGPLVSVCVVGALVFASCGGSDVSTADSASVSSDAGSVTGDSVVEDSAESLATFCKSALDNQAGADIGADDDPAAIAEKLSANAASLAEMAGVAPSELKADAQAVADAAKGMADAIAGDPSLEKFNSLIEEFATSDANAASERVQTWVNENCEAGQ